MNVGIRLDTGRTIGLGHLMRCLSLADAFSKNNDANIYFICRNHINIEIAYKIIYLQNDYKTEDNSYNFPDIKDELTELKTVIKDYGIDWLIVDHYGADNEYFENLQGNVDKLICIDDNMKRTIYADAVINGNIYGMDAKYDNVSVQLLGGKYTLVRSEFQNVIQGDIEIDVRNIYITSGGADPLGFCKKIVQTLNNKRYAVHVIIGCDFEENYIFDLENTGAILHKNADMIQCMQDADVFITSAGSTLYELAICGTPSISYVLAKDQEMVAKYLWEAGVSMKGGYFSEFNTQRFLELIEELASNWDLRKEISNNGRKIISSYGAKNVVKDLNLIWQEVEV